MDVKGALFGIGTGIIIMTAVVYGIGGGPFAVKSEVVESPAPLTDDEVITRAGRLGMVFITDLPKTATPTEQAMPLTENEIIEKAAALGMEFPPAKTPEELALLNEPVAVTIEYGLSARAVTAILKEKGLIGDSDAFEQYITKENMTRRIPAGTFSIPKGSSFSEILSILNTGSEEQ